MKRGLTLLLLVLLTGTGTEAQFRLRLRQSTPPISPPITPTERVFDTATTTLDENWPGHVFERGSVMLDRDTSRPANGSHTLTARCIDWGGRTTTSAGVTVMVNNPSTIPQPVAWQMPVAYLDDYNGNIPLTVIKSPGADVVSVEFFVDGVSVGTDTTSPYTVTVNSVPYDDDYHDVFARVTDSGMATVDVYTNWLIDNDAAPANPGMSDGGSPTCAITAPAASATVAGNVEILVTASDDNAVRIVEYLLDGASIGYRFSINGGGSGGVWKMVWVTTWGVSSLKTAKGRDWLSPPLIRNSSLVQYYFVPDSPLTSADYYIEYDLKNDANGSSDRFVWLSLRRTDATHFYGVGWYAKTVNPVDCYIFKYDGTFTPLASGNCEIEIDSDSGQVIPLRFGIVGDLLTFSRVTNGVPSTLLSANGGHFIDAIGAAGLGYGNLRNATDDPDQGYAFDNVRVIETAGQLAPQAPTISLSVPTSNATYQTTASSLIASGSATPGTGSLSSIAWTNSAGGSGIANGLASWIVTGAGSALTVIDAAFNAVSTLALSSYACSPVSCTWAELSNTSGGANGFQVSPSGYVSPSTTGSSGTARLISLATPTTPITAQNYDTAMVIDSLGATTDAIALIFGSNGSTTDFCAVVALHPSLNPDLLLVKHVAGSPSTIASANADYIAGNTITVEARNAAMTVKVGATTRIPSTSDGACDNDNQIGIGAGSLRGATGTTDYVRDLFTEAASVAITSHTPDVGGAASWSEGVDTASTIINVASTGLALPAANVDNAHIIVVNTPTTAPPTTDYAVKITPDNYTGTTAPMCAVGRFVDANNYYWGCVYGAGANPDVVLGKRVSGISTLLASADCSPTKTVFALDMTGTAISFSGTGSGGACALAATDSSLTATGKGGMGWGNLTHNSGDDVRTANAITTFTLTAGTTGDTLSPGTRIGNFSVVDQDAAGTGITLANGLNTLTFTATNTLGLSTSVVLAVTRGASDTQPPSAVITSPTTNATWSTTSATVPIGGTASDNIAVTSVTWACATCTPTSGTAAGTATWSFTPTVTCSTGSGTQNTVVVTPHDAAGITPITGTLVITCVTSGADVTAPVVTITTDCGSGAGANCTVAGNTQSLGGSASDAGSGVDLVTYACTAATGTATGTVAWTAASIPLNVGTNVCTVSARDLAGNVGTDSITITRAGALAITTLDLPGAVEDVTYPNGGSGVSIAASGGTAPYTFAVTSGSLPTGLSLSAAGALTGTPTTAGTYNFTVTVTDNVAATDPEAYTIIITATGAETAHTYFDTTLLGAAGFYRGWSLRPQAGHATNTDPYFSNQLLTTGGGFTRGSAATAATAITYSPETDPDPEKQDGVKIVIPTWQATSINSLTAGMSMSTTGAVEYLAMSAGGATDSGLPFKIESEIVVHAPDLRTWTILDASTASAGCTPAPCTLLTLNAPFTDILTGTPLDGYKKRVRINVSTPVIPDVDYTVTYVDATHVSIPVALSAMGTPTTQDRMRSAQDWDHVRVTRGQFGTTAAAHTSSTAVYRNVNSLQNQVYVGNPGGNSPLWVTEDGYTYLFTYDFYHTQSWMRPLNDAGYKSWQFSNPNTAALFMEPRVAHTGGNGALRCANFDRAIHVGGFEIRMYESVGGTDPWTPAQHNFLGPGVTGQQPLTPAANTFCLFPSVWTRLWFKLEQRVNDWDYLTVWIADENRNPVKMYDAIPISIRISGANNTLSLFFIEYNTSAPSLTRPEQNDLVSYMRNWAVLRWTTGTEPDIEATYITGKKPVR